MGAGEDSIFNGRLDYILNEIVAANQAGDLSILKQGEEIGRRCSY